MLVIGGAVNRLFPAFEFCDDQFCFGDFLRQVNFPWSSRPLLPEPAPRSILRSRRFPPGCSVPVCVGIRLGLRKVAEKAKIISDNSYWDANTNADTTAMVVGGGISTVEQRGIP